MKRNFYLQHPLIAMNDPRMNNLVEQEGLRGLGAYWFIIEKLAMLPESRANLKYMKPFCIGRAVPLSYLKKIICEYRLFTLDEDGFFMPAELNPAHKKSKKAAENVQENGSSEYKNDKKVQKMSNKQAEKNNEKKDNTLKNKPLTCNTPANNKENIKDIKTAATTEEKEETAAAAAAHPHTPPFFPDGQPLRPMRTWQELVDEMHQSRSWMELACMKSCYAPLMMRHLGQVIKLFKQHIELYGKGYDLLKESDVRSYFVNFVSAGGRTSQELHKRLLEIEAQEKAALPDNAANPYRHEQTVDGKRTYLGCPIPDNAPPRPDRNAVWNEELQQWMPGRTNGKKTR